jgi:hypothetical protein
MIGYNTLRFSFIWSFVARPNRPDKSIITEQEVRASKEKIKVRTKGLQLFYIM